MTFPTRRACSPLSIALAKLLPCAAFLFAFAIDCPAKKPPVSEDRYNAINQALAPIIAVMTRNGSAGNHSLDLEASVVDVAGLPEELKGAHLRIAYEFPDKLLVQFPALGASAIVCRNGQSVWAFPSSMFIPLVALINAPLSTRPLPPMEIDGAKAVFLPALLNVRDGGNAQIADRDYRVLDVRPIALSHNHEPKDWPGRLWIGAEDHRLAQLALRFSTWSVTLLIDKLELAPALPPETWNPTAEQHDQVTAVPGEKFFTLINLAAAQKK